MAVRLSDARVSRSGDLAGPVPPPPQSGTGQRHRRGRREHDLNSDPYGRRQGPVPRSYHAQQLSGGGARGRCQRRPVHQEDRLLRPDRQWHSRNCGSKPTSEVHREPLGQLWGRRSNFIIKIQSVRRGTAFSLSGWPLARAKTAAIRAVSTRSGPPACDAVKIRCRSPPYVVLNGPPIDRVPVEDVALRSVHRTLRHGVQHAHRFWWLLHRVVTGSPDPRQRPFRPEQRLVSGQLSGTVSGGADPLSRFPAALSATGIRFLGHPAPAEEFGLPHGRLTGHRDAGPHRGCHVAHEQDATGQDAPLTPRTLR
jgi:hypothetical protein